MHTKTHVKTSTNTQLGIAVLALFLAGGLAFASIPLNKTIGKEKNTSPPVGTPIKQNLILQKNQKFPLQNNTIKPILGLIRKDNQPIPIRTVICRTRWTADTELLTDEDIQTKMSEVQNYYNEVLFGKVNIQLSGIVTSDMYNAQIHDATGEFWQDRAIVMHMCDSVIDYSQVDLVITYPSLQNINYGTTADFQTQEGAVTKSILQLSPGQFISNIINHEIGHAIFGLAHSGRIDCQDQSFQENYNNCTIAEYDNKFDIMGRLFGHLGAWNKYLSGITMGKPFIQRQDVSSDGNYSLAALEMNTTKKQLLRVSYQTHPICIEYRKPLGIDGTLRDQLAGAAYGSLDSIPDNGGLILSLCYTKDNPSDRGAIDLPFAHLMSGAELIIDTSPHITNNLNDQERDNADIFIREGEVFSNDALGITLSWQQGAIQNTANIHIDINEERL